MVAADVTACLSEAGGCKICPRGWMASGTKCFWAADGMRSWSESRGDCASRGAELLMPGDEDELVKGPMASGMWDGSRGSAPTPVHKPLRSLGRCQCGGHWWGSGLRGDRLEPVLGWRSVTHQCHHLPSPPTQDILNRIIGKPSSYFWIGLSRPSDGKDWTWLNGSLVDWRR